MSVGAIPAVIRSRIASIESRFQPERDAAGGGVVITSAEFDPFGEAYQQALEAARTAPIAPTGGVPSDLGVRSSTGIASSRFATSMRGVSGVSSDPLVTAAINGVVAPPGQRPIGGYGAIPVPPELAPFGNGRIPTDRLSPIAQGGHRLYAPAAASWDNLVAAARADGFDLRITDSYRTYDQQVDLANRKGLYVNGGLAATPGKSNHGWGLAVDADLLDPAALAWMRENGPRFGWLEPVAREPWHWEFRPNQA